MPKWKCMCGHRCANHMANRAKAYKRVSLGVCIPFLSILFVCILLHWTKFSCFFFCSTALMDTIQIVQSLRNCIPAPTIPINNQWKNEDRNGKIYQFWLTASDCFHANSFDFYHFQSTDIRVLRKISFMTVSWAAIDCHLMKINVNMEKFYLYIQHNARTYSLFGSWFKRLNFLSVFLFSQNEKKKNYVKQIYNRIF